MRDDVENVTATAAAPARSSKLISLILVMNTLLLAGVLMFVMKRPAAQAAPAAPAAQAAPTGRQRGGADPAVTRGLPGEGPGPTMRLDEFIVQLQATEGDRYAHLTLEVEVALEGDKNAVQTRMPRIRDAVISHLSDRTEDELRGSRGLCQLKEALMKKLDEIVPGHRIEGLFVTEFIVQ